MAKKVTLQDIATAAGTSVASVSMILNEKDLYRFSQQRVDSVRAIARQLGYHASPAKIKRRQIAIISPTVLNPYHTAMITGIEQCATASGYRTAIYNTYWEPKTELALLDELEYRQTAGIIFATMPMEPERVRALSHRIPIVAVGDRLDDLGIDTVDVDNFMAAKLVAKHLIDLGHKHIAYATTAMNNHHLSRLHRSEGLIAAFEALCPEGSVTIYTKSNPVELEITDPDIEYHSGLELAAQCLQDPKITAIVAINDMIAYEVMDGLMKEGLRVPEDYSLCGFDNICHSGLARIGLTTVENFSLNHGKSAFRLLQERMESGLRQEESQPITRIEYHSTLVPRRSTGRPRG